MAEQAANPQGLREGKSEEVETVAVVKAVEAMAGEAMVEEASGLGMRVEVVMGAETMAAMEAWG